MLPASEYSNPEESSLATIRVQRPTPMSATGVTVSDEVRPTYEAMRDGKQYRYIVYYIKDRSVIAVDTTGERSVTYADFLETVQNDYANECRWFVYDYPDPVYADWSTKRVFITWVPEGANLRQQLIYKSTAEILRRELVGNAVEVEGSSIADISQEKIDAALKH
ncbi:cofilin/actin-depolymerizing factor homolog [Dermacentor silvarum]|uniref:cofilin/actin-depolymerizing factor homolog n=1 Tax=Dermacentor silvarum TaxID=543639 RepID=UPI0018992F2B|nr:cofilin/actin-depolymerizing factor homolog [Dermacentor silvarum]